MLTVKVPTWFHACQKMIQAPTAANIITTASQFFLIRRCNFSTAPIGVLLVGVEVPNSTVSIVGSADSAPLLYIIFVYCESHGNEKFEGWDNCTFYITEQTCTCILYFESKIRESTNRIKVQSGNTYLDSLLKS